MFLQPLRDEVEARMQKLVLGGESVLSMDAWQRMTAWERLLRAVSVERFCASDVAEAQFKGWAAERWVEEGVRVMDFLVGGQWCVSGGGEGCVGRFGWCCCWYLSFMARVPHSGR